MLNGSIASTEDGTDRDSSGNIAASADHFLTIPRTIPPFGSPNVARGDMCPGGRYLPIYYGDGKLWYVHDMETGREAKDAPLEPLPERHGPPEPYWATIDRLAALEAHRHRIVYFIGTRETAIKIGTSYSAIDRFKTIQSHSPIQLEILAVRQGGEGVEGAYHAWFADHRLHGEWFKPHPDIFSEIERLNALSPPHGLIGGRG